MSRESRRHYKQLSLTQLRSFCEVCRLGGYAAAAREVLLTPPAVWEQVQALERHLDARLLEREGNRVRPTVEGARLLELVRPLLAGVESLPDMLHQRAGVLPESLTFVTTMRVLVYEISAALGAFQQRYPAVQLKVRYVGSDQLQQLVLDRAADVTFTLEPTADQQMSPSIVFEPAADLDYLLVTPPGHPLATKKTFPVDSIVDYPLVLAGPHAYSRRRATEIFQQHHLTGQARIAVETSSDEYTLASVRAGSGIGIVVGNIGSELHRGMSVRPLTHLFGPARVGFLWRRGLYVPPVQAELSELVKTQVAGAHRTASSQPGRSAKRKPRKAKPRRRRS